MTVNSSVSNSVLDQTTIQEQTELEIENIGQVASAVRSAIEWHVGPDQLIRKISSVRFVAQSLQRYLDRLFSLEEHDGYMHAVVNEFPRTANQIAKFKAEHHDIRQQMRRLTTQLDRVSCEDDGPFQEICRELLALLTKVDQHHARESSLLQEAFTQDDGSSGD